MMFMAQAEQGQMDMVLWAKFRKEMEEKGTPLHEVIAKYEAELQAQAAQAQMGGQAPGGMTVPPAPEEAAPAPAAPPGIPPSGMLAGV
jgi:hypothetical protein